MNGNTLHYMLAGGRIFTGPQALSILLQSARQLDKAHAAGEIHGHLWPGELLVTETDPDGKIEVEIVKTCDTPSLEEALHAGGAPPAFAAFVPPEEILGTQMTGLSDQFSLAAIAYRLLQGRNAFAGMTLSVLFYEICSGELRLPRAVTPDARKTWLRGLAKDPPQRYSNCVELIQEIELIAIAQPVAIGASVAGPFPSAFPPAFPQVAPLSLSVPEYDLFPARRRRIANESPAPVSLEEPRPEAKRRPAWQTFGVIALALILLAAVAGRFIPGRPKVALPTQVLDPRTGPSTPVPPSSAAPPRASAPRASKPPAIAHNTVFAPAEPSASSAVRLPGASAAVAISTQPPGSTVAVDQRPETTCTSPCSMSLPVGRHVLSASLTGYLTAQRIFHVPEQTSVLIDLALSAGTLLITSDPPGSTIMLDGAPAGRTPVTLRLKSGEHRIDSFLGAAVQQRIVAVRPEAIQGVTFSFR